MAPRTGLRHQTEASSHLHAPGVDAPGTVIGRAIGNCEIQEMRCLLSGLWVVQSVGPTLY
jgi:hypothetical protein